MATKGNAQITPLREFFSGNGSGLMQWMNDGTTKGIKYMRPVVGNKMFQNALLRRDEWMEIDTAVMDIVRTQLVAADDFRRLGLVRTLGGIGTIITMYEQLGDMTDADVSMEGIVRGEKDRVDFTPQAIPVPIIHKDFDLSLRHLAASRRTGDGLDVTHAIVAARKVRDRVEQLIFNGLDKTLAGYRIYGFRNKPERMAFAVGDVEIGSGVWTTEGNAYKTVLGAIAQLQAAGFNGPYGVYVGRGGYTASLRRLTDGSSLSELNAILNGIPNISFFRVADALPSSEMIVWQTTPDVADLAVAQDIATIQWESLGGMLIDFRVMTVLVPRIKHDANDACGIVHITGLHA